MTSDNAAPKCELSPCYFCHSDAKVIFHFGYGFVVCQSCGARGPQTDNREKAIAAWNALSAKLGRRDERGITLTEAFDAGWHFYSQAFSPSVHDARDVSRLVTSYYWPAILQNMPEVDNALSKGSAIVAVKREIYRRLNEAELGASTEDFPNGH